MDGEVVRNLDLRRAVIGIMLREGRAMDLAEIEHELGAIGIITHPRRVRSANRVLSDLLSYQSRLGRVERVGRGRYRVVPESMTYIMRWRCQRYVQLRCGER